jgi:hypothetical protein
MTHEFEFLCDARHVRCSPHVARSFSLAHLAGPMNALARQCLLVTTCLVVAAPAHGQLNLDLGVGPVVPLGSSANQLATGVHAQIAIPFALWEPPGIGRIPHPPWPDALEFLRPRLSWRADMQYEQMAGPDRPMRVMAAEVVATRQLPRKTSWFIAPYLVGGVGAFNTQLYLRSPSGSPYAGTADARTNLGVDGGLGLTNFLAGYNVSMETKFRYVRNALSDASGTHIPMRAIFVMLRYTFRPPPPNPS